MTSSLQHDIIAQTLDTENNDYYGPLRIKIAFKPSFGTNATRTLFYE